MNYSSTFFQWQLRMQAYSEKRIKSNKYEHYNVIIILR